MNWKYTGQDTPDEGHDCRHLVTLEEDGMVWVGIRAYDYVNSRWLNNNEPESANVLAFMVLPEPANRRWIRGKLV